MAEQELTPRDKQEVGGSEQVRPGRYYVPDVDICDVKGELLLRADMPGVDPGKVSVEIDDGVLTIQGEVSLEPYEGLTPVYSEYRVGHFLRRFSMPRDYRYDPQAIAAKLVNGVLEVRIPKAAEAKPRRITVSPA